MNKPHKHAEIIKAWADGAEIQFRINDRDIWADCPNGPEWHNHHEYRIKPPAPKWPETAMSDKELQAVWSAKPGTFVSVAMRDIANAAIAHALETGQVALPTITNRDMVIGKAVKDAMMRCAERYSTGASQYIKAVDVAAVIESIGHDPR